MSATVRSTRSGFYPTIAVVLALLIIVGFSRTYYLRFLSDLPPLNALIHLHGLVFTAWLGLFIAQTQFIAANRVDLHMKLGMAGAGLAVLAVMIGVATVLGSAASPRIHTGGFTSPQFSIFGLAGITQFAVLVGLGLGLRRRAKLHKRFMVLAMISAVGPAASRLIVLVGAGKYGMVMQMGVTAAFVTWALVYDWRRNRVVHPIFAIGGLVLVLIGPLRYWVAGSDWWQPIGESIAQMGTFLIS